MSQHNKTYRILGGSGIDYFENYIDAVTGGIPYYGSSGSCGCGSTGVLLYRLLCDEGVIVLYCEKCIINLRQMGSDGYVDSMGPYITVEY